MHTLLVSPDALKAYMLDTHWSVRRLSVAVEHELERTGAERSSFSKSTLGHLVSGRRRYCEFDRARAIERLLGAPPNSLFRVRVDPDDWYREHEGEALAHS
jgi:hypothetical protein